MKSEQLSEFFFFNNNNKNKIEEIPMKIEEKIDKIVQVGGVNQDMTVPIPLEQNKDFIFFDTDIEQSSEKLLPKGADKDVGTSSCLVIDAILIEIFLLYKSKLPPKDYYSPLEKVLETELTRIF